MARPVPAQRQQDSTARWRGSARRWLLWRGPLFAMIAVLCSATAPAATITFDGSKQSVNPAPFFEVLEDPNRQLDFTMVRSAPWHNAFQPFDQDSVHFGYTNSAFWFRVQLANTSSQPQRLIWGFFYPTFDRVDLYLPDGTGGFRAQAVGDTLPYGTRPIDSRYYSVPFSLPPGGPHTVYLRLQSDSLFSLPMTVATPAAYLEHIEVLRTGEGLFYGFFVALVLIHLLFFLQDRDPLYVYFVLSALSATLLFTYIDGINYQLLSGLQWWEANAVYYYAYFLLILNTLFCRICLLQRHRHPHVDGLLLTGTGAAVLGMLLIPFLQPMANAALNSTLFVLMPLLWLYASLFLAYRGDRSAAVLSVAWVFISAVVLISGLTSVVADMPYYRITQIARVAAVIYFLMLSFVIAYRSGLLRRQHQEAQRRAAEAEARNEAKSLFLATISHEIRTPMNGVVGMADMLNHTALDDVQRRYVEVIQRSGENLLDIINAILDWTQIERGLLTLKPAAFNLLRLMDDVVLLFDNQARRSGLDFVTSVEPTIPETLVGDVTRLRQVLINLVGNAFKFTLHGGITVRVELATGYAGDHRHMLLRFSVRDTGLGIDRSMREKLFQPFHQRDLSSRHQRGAGLGLAISKQLSELMKGEIGVESERGRGSEFWFTARLERLQHKPARNAEDNLLQGQSLLLLGGRSSVVRAVKDYAGRLGVQVMEERRRRSGRSWRQSGGGVAPPSLVCLDAEETASTLADLQWLSQQTSLGNLPLLVLLPQDQAAVQRAVPAQVRSRFITGSLSYDPFREALLSTLVAPQPTASVEQPAEIRHESLRVLVAEDDATNRLVMNAMLDKLGVGYVNFCENGAELLDKLRADYGSYQLVLMDCEMPVLDGFQAATAIRDFERERQLPRIPIVAISAHDAQEQRQLALNSGMDEYLIKPVRLVEIEQVLKRYAAEEVAAGS